MQQVDLSTAAVSLGLANSPVYLLRRLETDPSVQKLSDKYSESEIFREMKRVLSKKKPSSLEETVWPYVALVALANKKSTQYLDQAASLPADHFQWFAYLAQFLKQSLAHSSTVNISSPAISKIEGVPASTANTFSKVETQ